nr:BTAD domain-containing putative transcriptional regulator [Planomonospora sp. ID67723]
MLGPLEIIVEGRARSPGGSTQRALVAILLLNTGRVVPVRELIGALWEDPPETALGQVQTRVWRLRTLLNGGEGQGSENRAVLVTRPGGYLLQAERDALDFARFEDGVGRARALLAEAGTEAAKAAAADLLEESLALWRGPAFSDVDVAAVRSAAAALEELRLLAVEERMEAALALGRHRDVVPELQDWVARHPFNERLRGQLMLALYRSERQAEALETYRDGHRLIVAELGVEPQRPLQDLHRDILLSASRLDRPDAGLAPPRPRAARPRRPRELPPDIAGFTGRDAVVEQMAGLLSEPGPVPAVAVVSGRAGTGKTAVAVHVAHRIQERFPDGQFFVDLRGLDRRPADASVVLARLLDRLGVEDGGDTADLSERSALYRAHMADRRVLLVLDNAGSEAQIRPLLPGGHGCAVIVTGRRRFGGLENARSFDLDVLTEDEAVELLVRTVGPDRAGAGPDARRIVQLCGRLPLAIRVAGARLRGRPHWRLSRLVDLLADERNRLDTLHAGDMGVRASVALSYEGIDERAARLFRLLGVLEAPTFGGWVAGPLLGVPDERAEELMETLVEARLIDVAHVDGDSGAVRYRIHDLLRLYARDRAAAEESAGSLDAALRRAFGRFLFMAEQAQARLPGGAALGRGATPRVPLREEELRRLMADPMAWFESERQTLVAVCDQLCARGLDEPAWELCCCAGRFLGGRWHADVWLGVNRRALDVVRRAGNRLGEAHLLRSLGEHHLDLDRYPDAVQCAEGAAEIFTELGSPGCAAHARATAALAHARTGRLGTALRSLRRTLAVFAELDDRGGTARALRTLGLVHCDLGRYEAALDCYRQSLDLFTELGDRVGGALIVRHLGMLYLTIGNLEAAGPLLTRSLEVFHECGDDVGEGFTLVHLGALYGARGDKDAAHRALARALEIFVAVGDRYGRALTLHHLGTRYAEEGKTMCARDCLDQAARIWADIGVSLWEARTRQARDEL